jgi:hypothetical protein
VQKMPDTHASQLALPPYCVEAFNIAAQLENKIHDHDVANSYGFSGALVPGTAVFGYMAHQPVALWGRDWLEKGSAKCHFSHPVYNGSLALVTAKHALDQMDIEVNSEGQLCASGRAAKRNARSSRRAAHRGELDLAKQHARVRASALSVPGSCRRSGSSAASCATESCRSCLGCLAAA